MSETSVTIGRILTGNQEDHLKNLQILSRLPSQEQGFSLFTREMFCRNTLSGKSYVTGFARSYNNIEHDWKNWISGFEDLLREMNWDSVNVFLETEMFGTHQYTWMRKFNAQGIKIPNDNDLIEKEDWYFGKGHRNFWGRANSIGWNSDQEEIRILTALVTGIDKNLQGKSAAIKLIKTEKGEYEIAGSRNGIKKLVCNLIGAYLSSERQHLPANLQASELLFAGDSPLQIARLRIEAAASMNDTNWIYHFVDQLDSEE